MFLGKLSIESVITLYLTFLRREVYRPPLLRFLWAWYKDQSCTVKWNSCEADPFGVSNGVRQGGVLSPILFTVYLDELLQWLTALGIGCHVGHHYVGSTCYADDITLLAPSPSALRVLLRECELFASEHNLKFNAAKTQWTTLSNSLTMLRTWGIFSTALLMIVRTLRGYTLRKL